MSITAILGGAKELQATLGEDEVMTAEMGAEGFIAKDGGFYTPSVSNVDEGTIEFSFAASEEGMPEVPDVQVPLPEGPAGYTPRKGIDYFDGEDGYTPQKGVDYFDGKDGYTPQKGKDYFDGKDGYTPQKGIDYFDGYTPVKGVDYFDGKDGYTPVKGKDYVDGKDGTSVTVSGVMESMDDGGINSVFFSDGKSLEVRNGKTGYTPQKGKDYFDGQPGKDGISATHSWDGTTLTITSASGTSSADLKGEKGDKGDTFAEHDKELLANEVGLARKKEVFEYTESPAFTNLLADAGIEYGKVINLSTGELEATSGQLASTGFIQINSGDIIRMEDFALPTSGTSKIVVYNSAKSVLSSVNFPAISQGTNYYLKEPVVGTDGNLIGFSVDKPSNGFIRITTATAQIGAKPVLTINEEITYEMTYGSELNKKIKVEYSQINNAPQKNCWSILPYERLNICYSSINRKPINTVEHFIDAATNFGYNALKCDVRPTSDGELVCCHDAGFTFNSNGKITTYDSANSTAIRSVTAATVLGYSFPTGEHPCLVGDYLDVCRTYGKVAFITIRNEYMDVVIPKLLAELKEHNMTYATIINCMTYESLVQWREQDQNVMINYTLNFGVAVDQMQIDRAVGLGYCSLCAFSLSSSSVNPSASCDFEYARANGIRLLEAIAYKEGSPEACYAMGYDGCQIGIPWNPVTTGDTGDTGGTGGKGLFYIEGDSTTAGVWSGTHNEITSYYDGLVIAYKTNIAGDSDGTTLNINGLGAKSVYRNASTKVTTIYPAGTVLILTYSDGAWLTADYDANTKTTAGTSNKTGSKMYLVAATSQTSSGTTTYTNTNAYIGTDNCLYSGGSKVYTASDLTDIVNSVIEALPVYDGGVV